MQPAYSIYLDLLRFGAALIVLLSHLSQPYFLGDRIEAFAHSGHMAVIVFFVLSGYVIAWVTDEKEHDPRRYAESRLARLYSVVLPALLLTLVLDTSGRMLDPALYEVVRTDNVPLVRFFANLFFLNEIWFLDIRPFSNGPFWSIGYEAWYYLLFGLWTFTRGATRKWSLAIVVVLLGPPILLMLPIWLIGVFVYRLHKRGIGLPPFAALAVVAATLLLVLVAHILHLHDDFPIKIPAFNYANAFLFDWLLGIVIAANLFAAKSMTEGVAWIRAALTQRLIARSIQLLAGMTFTMYLLHYPALLFFKALLGTDATSGMESLLLIAALFAFLVLVSEITERRKSAWRLLVSRTLDLTLSWSGKLRPANR